MEQVTALRAALRAHTVSCLNAKGNGYYERHAPLLDRIADTVAIPCSVALRWRGVGAYLRRRSVEPSRWVLHGYWPKRKACLPGDTPLIRRVLKGGRALFVNQDSVYTALARFHLQSGAAADLGLSDLRLHQIRKCCSSGLSSARSRSPSPSPRSTRSTTALATSARRSPFSPGSTSPPPPASGRCACEPKSTRTTADACTSAERSTRSGGRHGCGRTQSRAFSRSRR